MERRLDRYRGDREPIDVTDRLTIVVDDGLATGGTMRAAIGALQHLGAGSFVVAVPVGSTRTVEELQPLVDEVVCLSSPPLFYSIGQFYEDFDQTTDDEVVTLLNP